MTGRQSQDWVLTARWIFPIDGPPLAKGTVTICNQRLVAIEPHGIRSADLDLGNAALLPGFVNAHTHLDLTGLRGRTPPGKDFTSWLQAVIQYRRSQAAAQVEADIRAGLAESVARGTTLIGDISAQGLSRPIVAAAPVRAVIFYELLGLPRSRAAQAWHAACAWLNSQPASTMVRTGLSPHAPYSVRASLFRASAALARKRPVPLAIHLAETREERELLENQRGPFVDFLTQLGVWDPGGLLPNPEAVLSLHAGVDSVAFIHGNDLAPDASIPPCGSIVYCPRTHAAFGHSPHPFRRFLAAGIRVALGTDSLASNPDLDLLAEARFLYTQYPDLPGSILLRLLTLSGAEALGWQEVTGSLAPGKSADMVVLPLPNEDVLDPHALVLASRLPVQAVLWCGKWVYPEGFPQAGQHMSLSTPRP